MLLSEFGWQSPSDSGLSAIFAVNSQKDRGLAYRNYVEAAATVPYVVGIEYFTLVDEPLTGNWFSKYTGENYNTGFFSVVDRPYRSMIDEAAKTNLDVYAVMFGERPPFKYDNPVFQQQPRTNQTLNIVRAKGKIKLDGGNENWPALPPERIAGSRLVVGSSPGELEASAKLTWDDNDLYVLMHVTDSTPMQNSQVADQAWDGDAVELFVGHDEVDRSGPLLPTDRHILLGAGSAKGTSYVASGQEMPTGGCQTVVVIDSDRKGYTLEAAVPFSLLDFKAATGSALRFDVAIDDSADGQHRVRQLMWNGDARNSSDRGNWGHAILSP